jgi:tellurite resistance protein
MSEVGEVSTLAYHVARAEEEFERAQLARSVGTARAHRELAEFHLELVSQERADRRSGRFIAIGQSPVTPDAPYQR